MVGGGLKVGDFGADGFVDAAADTVAADGRLENLLGYDYSEASFFVRVGGVDKRKEGRTNGAAVFVGIINASTGMKAVFGGDHDNSIAQR